MMRFEVFTRRDDAISTDHINIEDYRRVWCGAKRDETPIEDMFSIIETAHSVRTGDLIFVDYTHWYCIEDAGVKYIGDAMYDDITFIDGTIFRVCDICGSVMVSGYMTNDGFMHYCSDECLRKDYTEEEYLEGYEADEIFYTEWY